MAWRFVTSNKPQRKDEVFVLNGGTFVMKLYAGAIPRPKDFARQLCEHLNQHYTCEDCGRPDHICALDNQC
jgi:hypothetical protein